MNVFMNMNTGFLRNKDGYFNQLQHTHTHTQSWVVFIGSVLLFLRGNPCKHKHFLGEYSPPAVSDAVLVVTEAATDRGLLPRAASPFAPILAMRV